MRVERNSLEGTWPAILCVVVLFPQVLLTCLNAGATRRKSSSSSPVQAACEVRFGDGSNFRRRCRVEIQAPWRNAPSACALEIS